MGLLQRVPQRTMDDCVICVVAMVTGYNYERVLRDSLRYDKTTSDGKFYEWWSDYLQHEGYRVTLRPFMDAYDLWKFDGQIVGLLTMQIPHLKSGHVVALDPAGVIDPADGSPDHAHLAEYVASRLPHGFVFDTEFLAVMRK
jgi:hypothetical protein